MTAPSPAAPWPGLDPYEEVHQARFFGRAREASALLAAVRRAPLSVLYGQSGLGKTSLLQAGLFPRLRVRNCLPVRIRLDFAPAALPLGQQVVKAIAGAAETSQRFDDPALRVAAPPALPNSAPSSLWAYFHRRGQYFWNAQSSIVTPVLVFDQFEEWFVRGATRPPEERQAFLCELHQLLDNHPPDDLPASDTWVYEAVPLTLLLALREDFLAHLSGLRDYLPGLHATELRLLPFDEAQAREVVEQPAAPFWPPEAVFTDAVLAALRRSGVELPATLATAEADANYDPSILSLLLARLFESLRAAQDAESRARLVRERGQDVLLDFYEQALMAARLKRKERDYLENALVTHSGLRNSVALDDATGRHGVRRGALESLRDVRVLHFDDRAMGHERVELAHDVLCAVALRARAQRRAHVVRRRWRTALAALLAVLLPLGWQSWQEWRVETQKQAAQSVADEARQLGRDGKVEDARRRYVEAIAIVQRSSLGRADRVLALRQVGGFAASLGGDLREKGRHTDAATIYRVATDAYDAAVAAAGDAATPPLRRDLADAQLQLGDQLRLGGSLPGALDAFRAYRDRVASLVKEQPTNEDLQNELSLSHNRIGEVLEEQGDLTGALGEFRSDNAIMIKLAASEPTDRERQRALSVSHNRLGAVLELQCDREGEQQCDRDGALTGYRAAEAVMAELVDHDSGNDGWRYDLSVTRSRVGRLLASRGDLVGALDSYRSAVAMVDELLRRDDQRHLWLDGAARIHAGLADTLRRARKPDEALRHAWNAEQLARRASELSPETVAYTVTRALVALRLGQVLLEEEPPQRSVAISTLRDGRDLLRMLRDEKRLSYEAGRYLVEIDNVLSRLAR